MQKKEALKVLEGLKSKKSLFSMNSEEIQVESAISIAVQSIKRLIPAEPEEENNKYFCPACGEEIKERVVFCTNENCGQLIKSN
jgi:predicted RNA-binding Zn-ribbon protein involved in translation (DUF1610 family)